MVSHNLILSSDSVVDINNIQNLLVPLFKMWVVVIVTEIHEKGVCFSV